MPYLNVIEVESALSVAASAPYTAFTQLINLPNLTWEGRQCRAIKIANGSSPDRPAVYFLGGVHSREWGSADILINFVEQIEQAYQNSTGLTFGSRTFSPAWWDRRRSRPTAPFRFWKWKSASAGRTAAAACAFRAATMSAVGSTP